MNFAIVRLPNLAAIAIAIAIGITVISGCGTSCDAKKAECSNECRRLYRVCYLHGNDDFYCHNQAAVCYENCGYDRKTCKEPATHFWTW